MLKGDNDLWIYLSINKLDTSIEESVRHIYKKNPGNYKKKNLNSIE